jgi:CHAT domain-containing protein
MKLYVRLLISVFCLAFLVYPLEAQDRPSTVSEEPIENLTTLTARQQALEALLKSAQELRQSGELLAAAQALNKAGHLQLMLFLPDEALLTFQENSRLADQVKDPAAKVDALNGLGAVYVHVGNYKKAIPRLQQAITIAEQNNHLAGRAEGLLLLSEAQNFTVHGPALATAQEALALWEKIGENRGIIRSHLSIGTYHLAQNSLTEATQSNETAIKLSRASGFKTLEAEALINLGFIEYRKGAWHNVTRFLWDAEKLIDPEAEPFKMTQIAASTADAYIESGLPETGLPKYQEALEYIHKTKRARDELVVRWGVGRAQYFSGKHQEALDTLQKTLRDAESQKQPVVMAMCHDYLGRTFEAQGKLPTALKHFQTSFDLYVKAENPMEVARLRARIGQIYEKSTRLEEAREAYRRSLQEFNAVSDRVNQSATLFALGRLEMKSGNYGLAETYLRESIDATENMRRMSTSRDLTAAFSATVHDRYELYIQCLMRNSDSSRVARAFETSESAQARSLSELLRASDTDLLSNIDPELATKERSLRQLLRAKEDERVGLLANKSGAEQKKQLEKLDGELERLGTEYKNVLATISKGYPAYEQITQPHSWDLRRIQEEVIGDNDTVLLEYLLGSEKSFVWVVTRTSITSRELPSREEISKKVQSLYNLLKEPAKPETKDKLDQTRELGRMELGRMILWPVAAELNKKQIIVAADDALNYIPFQILPAAPDNPEPLVAQHDIINEPSASILGELRKEAARHGVRAKTLAVFGNPIFATQNGQTAANQTSDDQSKHATRSIELDRDSSDPPTFGRLFYSAREIANLRDVATEAQTFTASDYDATRDQLLSMDFTQYAILHFATHGLLNPERPVNSGLLLSTITRDGRTVNGFVGLQDIYSLRAPVDLVVLSACQTGLGKDIRGEGLVGLTRGFMYAGATSVVASLWKVEDEATAELMKRFYVEMLKNRKTPAEALRAAQNSIRQEPQWSAPHYWAGFTLQGEYRYVVNSSQGWRRYSVAIVAAILFLLLAAAYWYHKKAHIV